MPVGTLSSNFGLHFSSSRAVKPTNISRLFGLSLYFGLVLIGRFFLSFENQTTYYYIFDAHTFLHLSY